jgi:hypothetical protein
MNANAASVLSIVKKKMRLEVPLFQRQYVWGKEAQWEPLWEDISRKFTEFLMGRKDGPVHFLGAMVSVPHQQATIGTQQHCSIAYPARPGYVFRAKLILMLAEGASFNTIKRRAADQCSHDHPLEAAIPRIRARRVDPKSPRRVPDRSAVLGFI